MRRNGADAVYHVYAEAGLALADSAAGPPVWRIELITGPGAIPVALGGYV
jgi:hypothetical protein